MTRRHQHQAGTLSFCLPYGFRSHDAELLGKLVLSEYDAVAFLDITAYRHRHILQLRMVQAFHGGIESVQVAVQYCTVHI